MGAACRRSSLRIEEAALPALRRGPPPAMPPPPQYPLRLPLLLPLPLIGRVSAFICEAASSSSRRRRSAIDTASRSSAPFSAAYPSSASDTMYSQSLVVKFVRIELLNVTVPTASEAASIPLLCSSWVRASSWRIANRPSRAGPIARAISRSAPRSVPAIAATRSSASASASRRANRIRSSAATSDACSPSICEACRSAASCRATTRITESSWSLSSVDRYSR